MPLVFAKAGEVNKIKKIGGKDDTKHFLNNLGFVEGGEITIISENSGNLINRGWNPNIIKNIHKVERR